MSIWFTPILVDDFNQRNKNTMAEFLGIQFTEVGDNFLVATMPVTSKTKQPMGIVHGGANVVLAETVASNAANAVIDYATAYCVGLEINANHIRQAKDGLVTATATPLHLGRSTHVWEIVIKNAQGKLTCISRMTAAVLQR